MESSVEVDLSKLLKHLGDYKFLHIWHSKHQSTTETYKILRLLLSDPKLIQSTTPRPHSLSVNAESLKPHHQSLQPLQSWSAVFELLGLDTQTLFHPPLSTSSLRSAADVSDQSKGFIAVLKKTVIEDHQVLGFPPSAPSNKVAVELSLISGVPPIFLEAAQSLICHPSFENNFVIVPQVHLLKKVNELRAFVGKDDIFADRILCGLRFQSQLRDTVPKLNSGTKVFNPLETLQKKAIQEMIESSLVEVCSKQHLARSLLECSHSMRSLELAEDRDDCCSKIVPQEDSRFQKMTEWKIRGLVATVNGPDTILATRNQVLFGLSMLDVLESYLLASMNLEAPEVSPKSPPGPYDSHQTMDRLVSSAEKSLKMLNIPCSQTTLAAACRSVPASSKDRLNSILLSLTGGEFVPGLGVKLRSQTGLNWVLCELLPADPQPHLSAIIVKLLSKFTQTEANLNSQLPKSDKENFGILQKALISTSSLFLGLLLNKTYYESQRSSQNQPTQVKILDILQQILDTAKLAPRPSPNLAMQSLGASKGHTHQQGNNKQETPQSGPRAHKLTDQALCLKYFERC